MGVVPKILLVLLVLAGGAAYWWFNRPEPDYVAQESGLYQISEGGKTGYVDKTGTVQIQPSFDWGGNFQEGLAPIAQQGKYGFIDTHGQIVIQPQFDLARPFINGFAAVKLCCGASMNANDQWGFIGKDGKYVINPQFQATGDFLGNLAPVKVDGSWGLVDARGTLVVKPTFTQLFNFSEGLAAASEGGRWGFIGKDGKFVIKPQFETATVFREQLAQVRLGGKVGFIDHSGKMVINPQFNSASNFRHGFSVVTIGAFGTSSKTATIDKNGKFLINPGQLNLATDPGDDIIPARNENGVGYVDRSGAWVVPPTLVLENAAAMHGGVASARIAGENCLIDKTGTVIWGAYKGQPLANIAKVQASEAAARASLQGIVAAQVTYSTTYPDSGYANQLLKLGPPPAGGSPGNNAAALISAALAQGEDNGYKFILSAPSDGSITSRYSVTATPAGGQATRVFCTNQMGVIRTAKPGETCDPDSSSPLVR